MESAAKLVVDLAAVNLIMDSTIDVGPGGVGGDLNGGLDGGLAHGHGRHNAGARLTFGDVPSHSRRFDAASMA